MSMSTEQAQNQPPTPPPARKRPPGVVLACVAAIIIVVLGGSLFWMVRSKSSTPGVAKATPTATAMPTWEPTEVTPPALSIFYDTFANDSHGWSLGGNGGYYRILVNNTLILADTNPGTPIVEVVPTNNLDNYVISTDFTINQGDANDGTGVYLRGDSTLDHDYRIDINGDNTIDIAKEFLDSNQSAQSTLLFPRQHASYLKPPGQQNTLMVIMLGPTITVEINNLVVATVDDASYTNGQIALFARHGSTSSGVTVSFSRVEIDRLASPFATPTPTPTLTPTATAN